MGIIAQLSDVVIDQIAAGEIIERPSSVIKELLENSVDSGANTISLHIADGGTTRIEVCDNGAGIESEDLPLSVARHTTSKIKSITDLNKCLTHGFRGEALAAIASVSNLVIISRKSNDSKGSRLEKIDNQWVCCPSPASSGTNVIIEKLFFKIPARKRFLKSKATEFTHCKNTFLQTALVHSHINWKFNSNGKEILNLPAENILDRFANICRVPSNTLKEVKKSIGPIKIHACFPFSSNEKKLSNKQFVYVNGRVIKNRTIAHAIKTAFEEINHGGQETNIFLSILIPNELVDFNVHPCKTEVRFKDNSAVYEVVYNTLKNTINRPAGENYTNEIINLDSHQKNISDVFATEKINPEIKSIIKQKDLDLENFSGLDEKKVTNLKSENLSSNQIPPLGFALAQLHGIYILAENSEGLIIVDIHAGHERILFEEYKKNIESKEIQIQKLISPIRLELDDDEIEIFDTNSILVSNLGFDVVKVSSNWLSIEGVPALTKNLNSKITFLEIIEDLSKFGRAETYESKLLKFLGNLACKSAIKANRIMTIPEMNSILRSMERTDYGGKCNHGRPSWAQLSITNIDKIFLRGK